MEYDMMLKENIKAKVDKLDNFELRIVELLIDSFKRKKPAKMKKPDPSKNYPYQQVIKLLGQTSITSDDINLGREDRL
jgi:hypothetical protein